MRTGLRGRRRGSALILVLLMTLAVAALAVAAIFMSSSVGLLSRFYDRERQFAYAAQSALDRVVSRLTEDTTFAVTGTAPISALDLTTVSDASGNTIAGASVRVWAARTGDTSSTGPVTISLLAQVSDASGTRFVRREDLRQSHIGQWSFISNGNTTSSTLPFASSSVVAGRVHVNGNWSTISQAIYRDSVSATGTFGTSTAANIKTGRSEGARRIQWPDDVPTLAQMDTAARADSLYFDVSNTYPSRVEFVWRDVNGDGIPDRDEGFVRIYELESGIDTDHLEVIPGSLSSGNNSFIDLDNNVDGTYGVDDHVIQNQCGAFYLRNGVWQFFPVATHRTSWAWTLIDSAAGTPAPPVSGNSHTAIGVRNILAQPTARCFPSGSPYLVNTERFTNGGGSIGTGNAYTYPFGQVSVAHRYGGQDTTITIAVQQCGIRSDGTRCDNNPFRVGTWRTLSSTPGWETLAPLDDAGRGAVVYFDNDIRLGGSVAGRVTLAVDGNVRIVDHLELAAGPNAEAGTCAHLFGLVAQDYIRVEQNLIAHRTRGGSTAATSLSFLLGGRDHFALHGAMLSIDSYFGIEGEDFRQGSSNSTSCEGSNVSMGCLRHVGSAAMDFTDNFSTANGRGARYHLTPDACFTQGYRPPYFPVTNRFAVLRAVDVRPSAIIGVNGVADYFATLQGTSEIP